MREPNCAMFRTLPPARTSNELVVSAVDYVLHGTRTGASGRSRSSRRHQTWEASETGRRVGPTGRGGVERG